VLKQYQHHQRSHQYSAKYKIRTTRRIRPWRHFTVEIIHDKGIKHLTSPVCQGCTIVPVGCSGGGGSTNGIIYGSVATLKHANVVLRHKLNDMMDMKARFWKRKRVSVSSFQCNPFTYVVRESGNVSRFHGDSSTYVVGESGNGNVFPFP